MRAFLLEFGFAFGVAQCLRSLGEHAGRIAACAMALRLDKDRPTRSQTAERVVEAAGDPDQLCWNRAVEVRATEARGALERAILVEDDAFAGERAPGQEIRQAGRGAEGFCKDRKSGVEGTI